MSLGNYKLYTDDKGHERVMFVDAQGKPLSPVDMSKAQSDVLRKERIRLANPDETNIVGSLAKGGAYESLEDQIARQSIGATDEGEVWHPTGGDTAAANIKEIARANASAPTQQDVMPTNEIPLSDKEVEQAFLQTKDSKGIDSGSSTQFNKGIGALGGTTAQLAAQTEDGTMSGGLSGLSTGLGAVSSLSMLGVGGLTSGAGAAAALTPVGMGVIAGSAILGAFMGSRKAKKARQAREKAEKQRQKEIKEKRTEDVYIAKMGSDQAAFANLQRAVSSALRRDNQVKIRT